MMIIMSAICIVWIIYLFASVSLVYIWVGILMDLDLDWRQDVSKVVTGGRTMCQILGL